MNKYRKALKNYTSSVRLDKVINDIQQIILDFGGTGIIIDYTVDQKVESIYFKILIEDQTRVIRVPLHIDKVAGVLKKQKVYKNEDHAYRVALANVRDWLDAQLAIYSTEMFEFPQIFLPYMQGADGRTFYEIVKEKGFTLGYQE